MVPVVPLDGGWGSNRTPHQVAPVGGGVVPQRVVSCGVAWRAPADEPGFVFRRLGGVPACWVAVCPWPVYSEQWLTPFWSVRVVDGVGKNRRHYALRWSVWLGRFTADGGTARLRKLNPEVLEAAERAVRDWLGGATCGVGGVVPQVVPQVVSCGVGVAP